MSKRFSNVQSKSFDNSTNDFLNPDAYDKMISKLVNTGIRNKDLMNMMKYVMYLEKCLSGDEDAIQVMVRNQLRQYKSIKQ